MVEICQHLVCLVVSLGQTSTQAMLWNQINEKLEQLSIS